MCSEKDKIDVIAQWKEIYVSSESILIDRVIEKIKNLLIKLWFIDSARYVGDSLKKLVQSLDTSQCIEIKNYFSDECKFDIIRWKLVFPYSYVNSVAKLQEEQLPLNTEFYDKLRNRYIEIEAYNHAKNAWIIFHCKNIEEYALNYLISNCIILTEYFEALRIVALEFFFIISCTLLYSPRFE